MLSARSFAFDFGIRVFLPSLAAAAGISLLLLNVFNGIFDETNNLDDTYARRSANAAIGSLRENMEALILDNAYWDDAVRNAYGKGTSDWLKETWGAGDEQEVYDAAFVVNADGTTTFASTSEDPDNLEQHTIGDYFGDDIHSLLAGLPETGTGFAKPRPFSNRLAGSLWLPPRSLFLQPRKCQFPATARHGLSLRIR